MFISKRLIIELVSVVKTVNNVNTVNYLSIIDFKDSLLLCISYFTTKITNGRKYYWRKIRKLAKICGWNNWEECTKHGLRGLCINILHNRKEINLTNKLDINYYHHVGPTS